MSDWGKWLIVLFGIVVFGVVGMTALDKYDERSCRQDPRIVAYVVDGETVPADEYQDEGPTSIPADAPFPDTPTPISETCDGFLPW